VGIGLVFALFIRSDLDITVAPVRNPLYVTLSDGTIRNTYEVRIRNMQHDPREFILSVRGDPAITLSLEGLEGNAVSVPADEMRLQRLYLAAPPGSAPARAARSEVRIWLEDRKNGARAYKDTVFNGRGE